MADPTFDNKMHSQTYIWNISCFFYTLPLCVDSKDRQDKVTVGIGLLIIILEDDGSFFTFAHLPYMNLKLN